MWLDRQLVFNQNVYRQRGQVICTRLDLIQRPDIWVWIIDYYESIPSFLFFDVKQVRPRNTNTPKIYATP